MRRSNSVFGSTVAQVRLVGGTVQAILTGLQLVQDAMLVEPDVEDGDLAGDLSSHLLLNTSIDLVRERLGRVDFLNQLL